MAIAHLIVLCLLLVISSSLGVDYCSKNLKCQRTPHIACDNILFEGQGWGNKCQDPELIEMTSDMKAALLDMHNKFRNQQAMGQTPNYKPATRMATLRWDNDLAKFAEANVRNCIYKHDPCHNTIHWLIAGQNLAKSSASGHIRDRPIKDVIVELGSSWFTMEHGNGKLYGWMKFINEYKLPKITDPTKHVGHFTQLVTDDAFAVGCAATRFNEGNRVSTILACNYSRANLNGSPVYVAGKTAADCKTGTNSKYPGLCSSNEKYEAWYYV